MKRLERMNKRKIKELEEHTKQPLNKRRKFFTGILMIINSHREYLECVKRKLYRSRTGTINGML